MKEITKARRVFLGKDRPLVRYRIVLVGIVEDMILNWS